MDELCGAPARRRLAGLARALAIGGFLAVGLSIALAGPARGAAAAPTAPPTAPPAPAAGAGSATLGGSTRYYVVGPEVDGRPEYLYQVAVLTLGDGNRYREIFDLNRGRIQPDGDRLTDPSRLRPGWVLILPPDAHGPRVHVGAPPTGAPTVAPPGGRFAARWLNWPVTSGLLLTPVVILAVLIWRHARDREPAVAPAGTGTTTVITEAVAPMVTDECGGRFDGAVASGPDRWHVRLAEVADPPAFGWIAPGQPLPAGGLPVVLGTAGAARLWADLARTPGPFTVTGPPAACRRQIDELAGHLRAAGRALFVVGDALGADLPAHYRRLDEFPASAAGLPSGILVTAGLDAGKLRIARDLVAQTGGSLVPVIVGSGLRSVWSMRLLADSGR